MGNTQSTQNDSEDQDPTQSIQKESEDQDPVNATKYSQISSEPPEGLKNGPVMIQPVQTKVSEKSDTVDARVSIGQDNAAVSPQKTMEISSVPVANGNNLGKQAKPSPPAAKSRFAFAFSRSVPGRTEEQSTNLSVGSAQLDVSSEAVQANKESSENGSLPVAAALEKASDKKLSETSLAEIELSAQTKEEDTPLHKPKESILFNRLFRLEKGRDKKKTHEQSPEEVTRNNPGGSITAEGTAGLQGKPDTVQQDKAPQNYIQETTQLKQGPDSGTDGAFNIRAKDIIDECNQKALQQDTAGANCLASKDLAQEEIKVEDIKITARTDNNNSVMSFFKTLVSPSKMDSKGDIEDKAKKDVQQTANAKSTEQQPVSIAITTPETNLPPSQENPAEKQTVTPPKAPALPTTAAVAAAPTEAPKEMTKEKLSSTPAPTNKYFWKKSSITATSSSLEEAQKLTPTDDIEVINTERIDASPEVPAKDESRSQEVADIKFKGEEKSTKTNLRKFFKLSVKSDEGVTPSEMNGQAPDHQTLDFTDRPSAQAENRDPAGKGGHASSTERLNKPQGIVHESKDQQEAGPQDPAKRDSLQNGGDAAKPNTPKRTEKRQPFGGFLKGLSPKRMSDAGVQTDPVSVVSVLKP